MKKVSNIFERKFKDLAKKIAEQEKQTEHRATEKYIDDREYYLRERLLTCGVSDFYIDQIVSGHDDTKTPYTPTDGAVTMRERLVAGETLVVLFGDMGTGKTLAICHEIKRLALEEPNRRVRMVKCNEISSVDYWDATVADVYRTADVLILDDVGSESERYTERVKGLVSSAYNSGQTVVITTNLEPSELKQHLGERVADRIAHRGGAIEFSERKRPRMKDHR